MTNKEIAEIGRQALNVRDYERLRQLFDTLDPPKPAPGRVFRSPSGEYGIMTSDGLILASTAGGHRLLTGTKWTEYYEDVTNNLTSTDEIAVPKELFNAWVGLVRGKDWNNGTHARKYRKTIERMTPIELTIRDVNTRMLNDAD